MALRIKESQQKYLKLVSEGFVSDGCNLCKETKFVKEFNYWTIINNMFPYDLIAKVNHMIIPRRHVIENELTDEEKEEFQLIKDSYIDNEYTFIIETVNREKSIPAHFHLHLIIEKDETK